jgi:hypothetical protein
MYRQGCRFESIITHKRGGKTAAQLTYSIPVVLEHFGDMSSFVGRFHRGFGSLGDMSSSVGSSILGLFFLV